MEKPHFSGRLRHPRLSSLVLAGGLLMTTAGIVDAVVDDTHSLLGAVLGVDEIDCLKSKEVWIGLPHEGTTEICEEPRVRDADMPGHDVMHKPDTLREHLASQGERVLAYLGIFTFFAALYKKLGVFDDVQKIFRRSPAKSK